MTQPTYDLLTEPWIPVLRPDGSAHAVGLREALQQAHQWRGLAGETPLVNASLYRLLLAVLYRALGTPSLDTWEEIWEAGRFPYQALETYFQRWRERFDLFHPERPFLQWADERVKPKSIIHLVPHMASGNNPTLFDHHHEGQEVFLPPDEAARALLVALFFGLSGRSGVKEQNFTKASWANGIIFLAEGDSLFETLMFNYLPRSLFHGLDAEDDEQDRPFWEAENPFQPPRSVPLGITDYLTWPNRTVRLFPEPGPNGGWVVPKVSLAPKLPLDSTVLDPYKHYRLDPKQGPSVLHFQEGRALWRDSTALLQLQSQQQNPPRPLQWLATLVANEVLPREVRFQIMALGMANNRAKIDFYREEHLPIPRAYLREPDLVSRLTEALDLAEEAGRALRQALHRLASLMLAPTAEEGEGRKPDPKEVTNLTAHWAGDRFYWAELEMPFWRLVRALPREGDHALEAWQEKVAWAAQEAFRRVADALGETPRALKAVARAERQLRGALFCVFQPHDPRCQAKKRAKSRKRR